MEPSNPSWNHESSRTSETAWRNRFYIADLHEILAASLELDKCQSPDSSPKHWPNISVLAVICPNPSLLESPTSSISSGGGSSTNSSPTSYTSLDSAISSLDDTNGSSLTSPTAVSQSSLSPTSPTFPTPDTEISRCHLCPATFTGTPQHRRSNLQRHMRTSRRHSGQGGFKCPEQGCVSTLMRTDNLSKHLQTIHGFSSPEERQDAIRRSRDMSSQDLPFPLETFLMD